jgi:hypothetical protein
MGMTIYYRDITGNYLGGFDGAEPPLGAIECTAPNHGLDKWVNGVWVDYVTPYQQLRASAYPPAADYLDAIVKGDTAQAQAYIDECLAVKAKYPK